jgi:hypothetical protein
VTQKETVSKIFFTQIFKFGSREKRLQPLFQVVDRGRWKSFGNSQKFRAEFPGAGDRVNIPGKMTRIKEKFPRFPLSTKLKQNKNRIKNKTKNLNRTFVFQNL